MRKVELTVAKGVRGWTVWVHPEGWIAPVAEVRVQSLGDVSELAMAFRTLGHEVRVVRELEEAQDAE